MVFEDLLLVAEVSRSIEKIAALLNNYWLELLSEWS
jgi:hypothetical protein